MRNAQHIGASGVLIADNVCLCDDTVCLNRTKAPTCEDAEPLMADDGSGSDITIPSFLVFKHDADEFKKYINKEQQTIRVQMEFEPTVTLDLPEGYGFDEQQEGQSIAEPPAKVNYEVWMSPTDYLSKEFLKKFVPIASALTPYTNFTPHVFIYDGIKSQCVGTPDQGSTEAQNWQSKPCFNLCTNNGRYCATDPDDDLYHGISGADVVGESLRWLCIWSKYGTKEGYDGQLWWNYVNEFYRQCFNNEKFSDETCIDSVFKKVGIDGEVINQCMKDSGGLTGDQMNNKLYEELSEQYNRGVYVMPTVHIQGKAHRGPVSAERVFDEICIRFPGKRPSVCQCTQCPDSIGCVRNNGICPHGTMGSVRSQSKGSQTEQSSGVSIWTFLSSIFALTLLTILAGMWHYQRSQNEMRRNVRGILNDYMPLEDGSGP